jgi:hypothetical protein
LRAINGEKHFMYRKMIEPRVQGDQMSL